MFNKNERQRKEQEALYNSRRFTDAESAVCSAAREPTVHLELELVRSLPFIISLWADRLEVVGEDEWPTSAVLERDLAELRGQMKLKIKAAVDLAASEEFPGEAAQLILHNNGYPPVSGQRSLRRFYNEYSLPATYSAHHTPLVASPEASRSDDDANVSVRLDHAGDLVYCMLCHIPLLWPDLLSHEHPDGLEPGTLLPLDFRAHEWVYSCKLYREILRKMLVDAGVADTERMPASELDELPLGQCARCKKVPRLMQWRELVCVYVSAFSLCAKSCTVSACGGEVV